jgi:hypothetical protein
MIAGLAAPGIQRPGRRQSWMPDGSVGGCYYKPLDGSFFLTDTFFNAT